MLLGDEMFKQSILLILLMLSFLITIDISHAYIVEDYGETIIEDPKIVIHIYSNHTVQIELLGKINESKQLHEYIDTLTRDSVVRKYHVEHIMGRNNYPVSIAVYAAKFYDHSLLISEYGEQKIILNNNTIVIYTNTTDLHYNYLSGQYVLIIRYRLRVYENNTLRDEKEGNEVIVKDNLYGLMKFLHIGDDNKLFSEIILGTIFGNSSLRYISSETICNMTPTNIIVNGKVVLGGNTTEYYRIYARIHCNDTIIGGFIQTFMDKLTIPNTIKYKLVYDKIEAVFPMITWDNNTLRDIETFFLEKYNLPSNTPVEIIADKNVSTSTTHTVLGELNKVEISFNKPIEKETTAEEITSFTLHGVIVAILILLISAIAIVSLAKKR